MIPWTETTIAGHVCEIFEPTRPSDHGEVVLYLHDVDGGRLEHQPRFAELFEQQGLRAIAPKTGQSWWCDRICEEFDASETAERYVLDQIVPYIEQQWAARPPQIALLGIGMGGQGSLRFAFKHPDTFPIVAAIAPSIDYQIAWRDEASTLPQMYTDPESVRQDTATLHIHPLYWPRNTWFACDPTDPRWFDSADRLRMKLGALGIPFDYDLETQADADGAAFDLATYVSKMAEPAITYLVDRLSHEQRRVV